MITVTIYDIPGLPHQSVNRVEDGHTFRVTPTGALEVIGNFDTVVRAYAPGKWIEAKK